LSPAPGVASGITSIGGFTMADYATLLRDDVVLMVRSVDRIFLHAYIDKLQTGGGAAGYLLRQRGMPFPSSAAYAHIGEKYAAEIRTWAEQHDVPIHHFEKGESKEQYARPLIDAAAEEGGKGRVVLLGIAQEKALVWRSWRDKSYRGPGKRPQMAWGRHAAFINHFYFYVWDPDWGPAFWKTNAYAPYPVWVCLNGHEWAKRQLEKSGINYEALDNGFRSCADPEALQRICDRLSAGCAQRFFWRWFQRLPTPIRLEDVKVGYVYEMAFRQFEISDTRIFNHPQAGRAFFEGLIRDHLDIGRPQQVVLIFNRRLMPNTPSPFSTKVITRGVDPQLSCTYKSSRLKQYFKENRALRTETTICNTRDFGIGRRVNAENWRALRGVGESTTMRLCDAQAQDAQPAPDVVTVRQVTRPSITRDGLHAPALCFGDPRVMALLTALVSFAHLFRGFRNQQLVELVGALLDTPYSCRQATYDLRRLQRKGLIHKLPHSHRYQLTPEGRSVAVLFLKVHGRVLGQGFALLRASGSSPADPPTHLRAAWRRLDSELDAFIERQMIDA
jgi:hypothetical protein